MRQSGKLTEDETGHANVIVMTDVYRADPMVVVHERFILVEGKIQNQDGTCLLTRAAKTRAHIYASRLRREVAPVTIAYDGSLEFASLSGF